MSELLRHEFADRPVRTAGVHVDFTVQEADFIWSILDSELESARDIMRDDGETPEDLRVIADLIDVMNLLHTAIERGDSE